MNLPHDDDAVWKALAHPLRRAILDVLRLASRTTGGLVDELGTSRHVVMQHLGVLREADLVLVEPRGRERVNHLNPVPIQQIHQRWVAHYEENWAAALVTLKHDVERDVERGAREGRDVG